MLEDLEKIRLSYKNVFRKDVGDLDNFFSIGGHSLIAGRIVSFLRKQYNIKISVIDIFKYPTIKELYQHLRKLQPKDIDYQESVVIKRNMLNPLSLSQKRLWFLFKLNPTIPIYTMPITLSVKGFLCVKSLKKALNLIIKKHESLRTRIKCIDNVVYQDILSDSTEFPFFENEIAEEEITEKIEEENSTIFDLEKDILCRCLILRIGSENCILNFLFSHIVFDDWSQSIFSRELSYLYNSILQNHVKSIEKLEYQYLDFSNWQYQKVEKGEINGHLSYWCDVLDDFSEPHYPLNERRPKKLSYEGKKIKFMISAKDFDAIRLIMRQYDTSLFQVLLAIFFWDITFFTNSSDLVIGTPITNRPFSWQEKVIGYFVNTLALRAKVSKNEPFIQFLERIKQMTLCSYQHQEAPFEKIVEKLSVPREVNKNPLFQILFSVSYESEISSIELESLKVSPIDSQQKKALFDISFLALVKDNSIEITFEYSKGIYDDSTIVQLSNFYQKLVYSIPSQLSMTLSEFMKQNIPMLSFDEISFLGKNDCGFCLLDEEMNPLLANVIGKIFSASTNNSSSPDKVDTGYFAKFSTKSGLQILGKESQSINIKHGPRIFFSEIYEVLNSHTEVQNSAIKKIGNTSKINLEIYLECASSKMPSDDDLINFLQGFFPLSGSIIRIFYVECISCKQDGTIDFQNLITVPKQTFKSSQSAIQETENQLIQIFEEIFKKSQISRKTSFFDQGGTSFMVMDLCNKIEKKMGCVIKPIDIFQYPTVGQLARFCSKNVNTLEYREKSLDRKNKFFKTLSNYHKLSKSRKIP